MDQVRERFLRLLADPERINPVVAAETVGLLVPRSSGSGYYDRFRHRLMFAVMDAQGRVVAFSCHPEDSKDYKDFVVRAIDWTTKPEEKK